MLSIAKGWALSTLTADLKCLLLPQGMIQSLKHISMKLEDAGVIAEVASESPFTCMGSWGRKSSAGSKENLSLHCSELCTKHPQHSDLGFLHAGGPTPKWVGYSMLGLDSYHEDTHSSKWLLSSSFLSKAPPVRSV